MQSLRDLNLSMKIFKISVAFFIFTVLALILYFLKIENILMLFGIFSIYFGLYVSPVFILMLLVDRYVLKNKTIKLEYFIITFFINIIILLLAYYVAYHAFDNLTIG